MCSMSATAAVVPMGTESARDQLERRDWSWLTGGGSDRDDD